MGFLSCCVLCSLWRPPSPVHKTNQKAFKLKVRFKEHEKSCEGNLLGLRPAENNYGGIPFRFSSTGHRLCSTRQRYWPKRKIVSKGKLLRASISITKRAPVWMSFLERRSTASGLRLLKIWSSLDDASRAYALNEISSNFRFSACVLKYCLCLVVP